MRPDQQHDDVVETLKTRANQFSYTVASNIEFNEAIDAVAEYIAANDEYDAALTTYQNRPAGSAGLHDALNKASVRRALAHARMKGEAK